MSGWPDKIAIEKRNEDGETPPILIVADEVVMRNAIEALFRDNETECIMTDSVITAFKELEFNPKIQHVVIDCVKTDMDLEWFLMELKNANYQVLVFGSSDSNDPEDFHRYGRVHHLPKFWNIARLNAAIEQATLLSV